MTTLVKEAIYKKTVELYPNDYRAYNDLGMMAYANGDFAAAETYLSKSTGANTANEALGNLYIKQGQYDRAVQAFGDTKTNSATLAAKAQNDREFAKYANEIK